VHYILIVLSLSQHPAPAVPQSANDEGTKDILPPQKKNVGTLPTIKQVLVIRLISSAAKYYHEDQLAIAAAVATQNKDVRQQVYKNPPFHSGTKCTFSGPRWRNAFSLLLLQEGRHEESRRSRAQVRDFLPLVYSHPLKHNTLRSDDAVYDEFVKTSPKQRRVILRACISQRRTSILARAVKFLQDDPEGPNLIPHILHGCETPIVAKELPKYKNHQNIQWQHMCHYHGSVILAMMREDLLVARPSDRSAVWTNWWILVSSYFPTPLFFFFCLFFGH